MNDLKRIYFVVLIAFVLLSFNACQQAGGNKTGSEFMPDMAHSIAYEANTYSYFYYNTWGSEDEYYQYAMPKEPVKGTVPRSIHKRDMSSTNNFRVTGAGAEMPYYYGDTEEERTRAGNEIIQNPLKITEAGLVQGKELYDIYCGICHGEKGDGAGYLVREADPAKGIDAGVYPAQPANFLLEEFLAASNGRYYHAIQYGKNVMGNYRDKLSYEERWNVIHYIRSLQAKELKLEYNQMANTLNNIEIPAGEIAEAIQHPPHGDAHSDADADHGADHDGGDGHDAHGADHDDSNH